MLLEARSFSAAQMLQRGFISRVVVDAEVAQEATATAARICALSPQAARLNKQVLRALIQDNGVLAQQNRAQAATQCIADAYTYADSPEHREGITAFIEKRPTHF
jgi:enoyl-CoA hydratase